MVNSNQSKHSCVKCKQKHVLIHTLLAVVQINHSIECSEFPWDERDLLIRACYVFIRQITLWGHIFLDKYMQWSSKEISIIILWKKVTALWPSLLRAIVVQSWHLIFDRDPLQSLITKYWDSKRHLAIYADLMRPNDFLIMSSYLICSANSYLSCVEGTTANGTFSRENVCLQMQIPQPQCWNRFRWWSCMQLCTLSCTYMLKSDKPVPVFNRWTGID